VEYHHRGNTVSEIPSHRLSVCRFAAILAHARLHLFQLGLSWPRQLHSAASEPHLPHPWIDSSHHSLPRRLDCNHKDRAHKPFVSEDSECCLLLLSDNTCRLFFALILLITFFCSMGASYLQSSVIALSSLFGPLYLQGILAGM
jgi:hypothetical protein